MHYFVHPPIRRPSVRLYGYISLERFCYLIFGIKVAFYVFMVMEPDSWKTIFEPKMANKMWQICVFEGFYATSHYIFLKFGMKLAWYTYYFEYETGSFPRKNLFGQKIFSKWQKWCKKYLFWAFIGSQPLDFSDFWYETSLI